MAFGAVFGGVAGKAATLVAANKVAAVAVTGALVAAGGTATAVSMQAPEPSISIEDVQQSEPDEPTASPSDEVTEQATPAKPDPTEDSEDVSEKPEPAPSEAAPETGDQKDEQEHAGEDAAKKDESPKKQDTTDAVDEKRRGVDIAIRTRGDAAKTVVMIDNVGDRTSDRVKLKYQGAEGASGRIKVLSTSGNVVECDGWFCYFDDLKPGTGVASVTFTVTGISCTHADGGGKLTAHYEHDANHRDNYGWVDWCDGVQRAASDISIDVTGSDGRWSVAVHNAGPDVARDVKVKMHSVRGAKGTIHVAAKSGNVSRCDGWYCYFSEVPVGRNVASLVFEVEVHECWDAEGGATLEAWLESDPKDSNDRVFVRWCSADDIADESPEKPGVADLSTSVAGDASSYKVKVTNVGDATATNVVLEHWVGKGAGELTLLESSHAGACSASRCELDALAPGQSVWIRVALAPDCEASSTGRVEALAASGSHDGDEGNNAAGMEYRC